MDGDGRGRRETSGIKPRLLLEGNNSAATKDIDGFLYYKSSYKSCLYPLSPPNRAKVGDGDDAESDSSKSSDTLPSDTSIQHTRHKKKQRKWKRSKKRTPCSNKENEPINMIKSVLRTRNPKVTRHSEIRVIQQIASTSYLRKALGHVRGMGDDSDNSSSTPGQANASSLTSDDSENNRSSASSSSSSGHRRSRGRKNISKGTRTECRQRPKSRSKQKKKIRAASGN